MLSVKEILKIGKFNYTNVALKRLYTWYILLYTYLYIINN